jgi:hypothetical protein
MGWSIGYDSNWNRDIGYDVPAVCDHPKCNNIIDRGMAYVCGGEPYGGEKGCGLYFCYEHLYFGRGEDSPQLCERCMQYKKPYKLKPDTLEWIAWKLADDSWEEWRKENSKKVKQMEKIVNSLTEGK